MADKKSNQQVEEVLEQEPTATEIAIEEKLNEEELLADLPELKAPEKLRIRERNRLINVVMKAEVLSDRDGMSAKETQAAAMELIADIDEFAESIALNPEAYVEWSEGREYDAFMAILNRYATALGK